MIDKKWLNEIEETVIDFNEDCIIPKQIILEIISSLRHECEQLQAEQQAHNALREKLKELEWLWFEDDELAGSGFVCPCCEQRWDNGDDINANKHLTGCWLNAELKSIKEVQF